MYLVVGLGNPGERYAHTRHNAGFDVLDILAQKLEVRIGREKENALIGECFVKGEKVILALPQTYMNLSGLAVRGLLRWYGIPLDRLLVVYDDIDLPQGTVRLRKNGSAGTHNGMRSIVAEVSSDAFPRVRVGIGSCQPGFALADWVTSRYQTQEEQERAQAAYKQAADGVLEFLQNGMESAMCKYNTKKPKAPKPLKAEGEGAGE